ncbi:hypothetical protein IHE44_0013288 [Lamprotornis superbus]|uniref:cGMP-dependent protein kinase n=1 Tax=Lamprotornis superbus TaxID=245042 RepID=A0A835NRV2_9PASS|nr:hypothetical protein IHE44_0013288 [Lamprotornis superbus]
MMSLDKMGNGLVKPKHLRQPNRHVANLAIGCAASHKFLMDPCLGINVINGQADVLCSKVLELEKELKRKDQQLQESQSHVAELQEQLAMQTKVIAELTKELQSKCIQLNKLQDVVSTQGEHSLQPSPFKISSYANRRRGAKEGVSAEPTTRLCDLSRQTMFSLEKATVRKDSSEKKLITDALNKNQFLKRLEPHQTRDMVECMYERTFQQGSYVIRQGEPGNHIFVLKAITNVKTWALDREVFQNIMRVTAQTRQEQYRNFLRSVSLLKNLPEDKLTKIMDCLEVEYYDKGDYVIREGEEGNTFFIIAKGKVIVTQSTTEHSQPQVIKNLHKGDYFGEKALISDDVRSANVIADEYNVECLVIDREGRSFCGQLTKEVSLEMIELKEKVAQFPPSPFQNLEVVTTLGVGGFGRVELVKVKNENMAFAMKCIKKKHVVDTKQQEHIYSEKKILEQICSPFVVKLYRTFKDNKYVYMLLEACLGGELWSLLRDRGSFDEFTTKFCVGCVTEAFDYLHQIGIIYRDLKPENLILDAEGYIKLVDFGFAKKIGSGQKTWTFCGTPEYVAPEVILSKGHDFSVDFWSLGILVYELLTGSPPFSGADQMMTYNLILKGIEKLDFPKTITRRPEDLIRRLCRQNPTERLGNLRNGINDIKKHRWLSGFNWDSLKVRDEGLVLLYVMSKMVPDTELQVQSKLSCTAGTEKQTHLCEYMITWLLQCRDNGTRIMELEGREAKLLGSLTETTSLTKTCRLYVTLKPSQARKNTSSISMYKVPYPSTAPANTTMTTVLHTPRGCWKRPYQTAAFESVSISYPVRIERACENREVSATQGLQGSSRWRVQTRALLQEPEQFAGQLKWGPLSLSPTKSAAKLRELRGIFWSDQERQHSHPRGTDTGLYSTTATPPHNHAHLTEQSRKMRATPSPSNTAAVQAYLHLSLELFQQILPDSPTAAAAVPKSNGLQEPVSAQIHTSGITADPGHSITKYKAKASRSPSDGVQLQSAVYNFTKLREVVLQILLRCVPAKATNEHFPVKTNWSICQCYFLP